MTRSSGSMATFTASTSIPAASPATVTKPLPAFPERYNTESDPIRDLSSAITSKHFRRDSEFSRDTWLIRGVIYWIYIDSPFYSVLSGDRTEPFSVPPALPAAHFCPDPG